ncbi:hypothetical protein FN846DRAFT_914355 [Sphaerosporella brunnea]|uniref:Uncharacterized protein n=1 Tax=Sphaerosporella brunnea TaxID=1250544 RepID=A0A5J5EDZ0_9PEZI|nr:hypothetical protein FN846DRAFT_914355 [Sphaerosporella brunnea]
MSDLTKRGRDFRSPSTLEQAPSPKRVCSELDNVQFISGPTLDHRKSSNVPELTMKNLNVLVPNSMTLEIKKATTREEWGSKVRFFMAYMFYRARSFPEQGIKNLLHHFQPIGTKVVRSDREVSFVKQLVDDLQDDIARSHEAMARLFMSTELGQEWIADVDSKRAVQRGIPWLNAHSPQLLKALQLSPTEFSSLWTPILHVVNSSVWTDTEWRQTSQRLWAEDTYIFSAMRWASLEIIARFSNAMHSSNANTRYLSVQIRQKVFRAVSPLDFPELWPAISTDQHFHPTTPQAWASLPDHYPVCYENNNFRDIFHRFGKAGQDILVGLTPRALLSSRSTPEVNSSQQETSTQESITTTEPTHPHDSLYSYESTSQPAHGKPTASTADDNDHNTVDHHVRDAQGGETAEHLGDVESFGMAYGTDSEEDDSFFCSQDGTKIPAINLQVDRDVAPARSSSMRTGTEVDKVSEDVVQQIMELVRANNNEDCAMVHDFIRMYDPPVDYLTQRAFDLSRMGGSGLAKYAIEDLYCDAEIYRRLGDYFHHRRLEALDEAAKVEEQVRVAAAAQEAAESQEAAYRQMSRRVGAAKEAQLNALRRATGNNQSSGGSRPTFPSLGLSVSSHKPISNPPIEATLRSTPGPKRLFDEHAAFGT